jgi:hypothetical protein
MRAGRTVLRTIALLTIAALLAGSEARGGQSATVDAPRWRAAIAALEPAAFVSLRLRNGKRLKGTVVATDERTFVFAPRTRIPVDPVEIAYADVAALERTKPGMSPGLKVLIGGAAGVGGFLMIIVTALALSDD